MVSDSTEVDIRTTEFVFRSAHRQFGKLWKILVTQRGGRTAEHHASSLFGYKFSSHLLLNAGSFATRPELCFHFSSRHVQEQCKDHTLHKYIYILREHYVWLDSPPNLKARQIIASHSF